MRKIIGRRDEYEQDVFAGEPSLLQRKSLDDLDTIEENELEGLDGFDLEEYEREAFEEDR